MSQNPSTKERSVVERGLSSFSKQPILVFNIKWEIFCKSLVFCHFTFPKQNISTNANFNKGILLNYLINFFECFFLISSGLRISSLQTHLKGTSLVSPLESLVYYFHLLSIDEYVAYCMKANVDQ